MPENILYLEKRGCDFFAGDPDCLESDVGNYRLDTPGYDIRTKDGRAYLLEFTCYDRYQIRVYNKRTGAKLKHPVRELVMTCACSLSPYWIDDNGTCWGDHKMTREFYETPRKYTLANILEYVNSISVDHYDRIELI